MIAQDVIHSFYVPAFRVKRDVIPGRYTTVWFEATKTGSFHLFCAEYCGTEHSGMVGQVIVLEPRQYQDWLSQRPLDLAQPIPEQMTGAGAIAPASTLAAQGEARFQSLGCANCHHMDGNGPGPSLMNLLGSEVELASGETVVADEQYIRRSIIDPNAQVVAGYPPIMPTYAGQINEDELFQLIEYIRNLTTPEAQRGNGESQNQGAVEEQGDAPGQAGDQPDAADTPVSEGAGAENLSGDSPDAADQNAGENGTPAPSGTEPENNP
jgi:cytochrome c oxidase subunit 2